MSEASKPAGTSLKVKVIMAFKPAEMLLRLDVTLTVGLVVSEAAEVMLPDVKLVSMLLADVVAAEVIAAALPPAAITVATEAAEVAKLWDRLFKPTLVMSDTSS